MKTSDTPLFLKKTSLPTPPFYGKYLNSKFLRELKKIQPHTIRKQERRGGGSDYVKGKQKKPKYYMLLKMTNKTQRCK